MRSSPPHLNYLFNTSAAVDDMLTEAKPNAAHRAIAALESGKSSKQVTVMTQNIDGLHKEAGSSKVYQLHGTAKSASCMSCKTVISVDKIRQMLRGNTKQKAVLDPANISIPICPVCSSKQVKTDVVLFGEQLPGNIMGECMAAITACDVVIMVGNVVYKDGF